MTWHAFCEVSLVHGGGVLSQIGTRPAHPSGAEDCMEAHVGDRVVRISRRFALTERVLLSQITAPLRTHAYARFKYLSLNNLYDDSRYYKLRDAIERGLLDVADLVDIDVQFPDAAVWADEPTLISHIENIIDNSLLALDFNRVLKCIARGQPPAACLRPRVSVRCVYPDLTPDTAPNRRFACLSVEDDGTGIDGELLTRFRREVLFPCKGGRYVLTDHAVRARLDRKRYSTRSGAGLGQAWPACAFYCSRLCLVDIEAPRGDRVLARGRMDIPRQQPRKGARVDLWLPAVSDASGDDFRIVPLYEEICS